MQLIWLHYISCGGPLQAGSGTSVFVNKIICWSAKLHTATAGTLVLDSNVSVSRKGGLPFLLSLIEPDHYGIFGADNDIRE